MSQPFTTAERNSLQLLLRSLSGDTVALDAMFGDGMANSVIRTDLTDLVARDSANLPNGSTAYVVSENETYRLDTSNTFAAHPTLVIARSVGTGRWFRRSKAYVVGNFTLWVAPFGGVNGTGDSKLGGFTPGQITASNANAPDIALDLAAAFPPATMQIYDMLTDALGNLWVTALNNAKNAGSIQKFLLKDCLSSGAPAATVVINFVPPVGLNANTVHAVAAAFDKQNNLWLSMGDHGTAGAFSLYRYNQKTYATSGSAAPDAVSTVSSLASSDADAIVFDAEGNLWAAIGFVNGGGNKGGVIMLAASQINVSNAAIVPAVFWQGTNFPGGGADSFSIQGLAFGPTGLLWVIDYSASTIKAYDPRLPSSGNPAPVISLTSTTFNGPIGVAFDAAGNMWVANDNDNLIYRLTAASIAASGAVVPDIVLSQTTILAFPDAITFPNNPDRSGLLASGVPLAP